MDQLALFRDPNEKENKEDYSANIKRILNGEYIYYPDFFKATESNSFFKDLREDTCWKQESMNMYGKKINFPRLTAWYGDDDKAYSFSGLTLSPLPWTPTLKTIKQRIETQSATTYNSVLLNLYRDGSDSISWHTDAEPELGKNPIIASVNFGASRIFQLRHIITREKIEIELTNGSLLIMKDELQHFWQHQVPKTSRKIGERINLTFRLIN